MQNGLVAFTSTEGLRCSAAGKLTDWLCVKVVTCEIKKTFKTTIARLRQRMIMLRVTTSTTEIRTVLATKKFYNSCKTVFSKIKHVRKYS